MNYEVTDRFLCEIFSFSSICPTNPLLYIAIFLSDRWKKYENSSSNKLHSNNSVNTIKVHSSSLKWVGVYHFLLPFYCCCCRCLMLLSEQIKQHHLEGMLKMCCFSLFGGRTFSYLRVSHRLCLNNEILWIIEY